MAKRKTAVWLVVMLFALMICGMPVRANETQSEKYIKYTAYAETMTPSSEKDGELTVTVQAEAGKDGYIYLFQSLKGMKPSGDVKGSNIQGKLEALKIGSVSYFRVKAEDPSKPSEVTQVFSCEGFYAPKMTVGTNGKKDYPIAYKFADSLSTPVNKYALRIFLPKGYEPVKVTAPGEYEDYILGEKDGMRFVGLNQTVKPSASASLKFTFNKSASVLSKSIIWVLCLGIGGAVLVDRARKEKKK